MRFKCLEKRWQEMGRMSSLKTLNPADVENYLRLYLPIVDLWWSLESRASSATSASSFFAKVDSELKVIFPGATIMLPLTMGKI
jgi:hypothetical protein